MSRSTWAILAATVAGLILWGWTLDKVGLMRTVDLLVAIRPAGLLGFMLVHASVLLALGFAWEASAVGGHRRPLRFVWARTVREAASDLLPFSQVGGLFFGVRVLTDAGIPPARVYAATVIDLTTEMASQILLVLCGIAISINLVTIAATDERLRLAIWCGTGILCLLGAGLLLLRGLVLTFAGRIADKLVPAAGAMIGEVRAELARFEMRRGAILRPFLWNVLAWLLSVVCVWIGLELLGHGLAPQRVLALEALISVVRSGAFFIPGAVGVQEAGYVVLASVVGLDPSAAVALSLLKRARDIAVGIPTLVAWQTALVRRRTPTP